MRIDQQVTAVKSEGSLSSRTRSEGTSLPGVAGEVVVSVMAGLPAPGWSGPVPAHAGFGIRGQHGTWVCRLPVLNIIVRPESEGGAF